MCVCLPAPDFTIIADTLTKGRPKSFEDIAYRSIRCLICSETRTSTPLAGDNANRSSPILGGAIVKPVVRPSRSILSKVIHTRTHVYTCVCLRSHARATFCEMSVDDNAVVIARYKLDTIVARRAITSRDTRAGHTSRVIAWVFRVAKKSEQVRFKRD